tara:strand:- start:220 stop:726 length:507 start_codon:yes stop_codon:yes gene_type:complete
MPCKKCKDGKYKYGNTGECKYDTKEECDKANPNKYNKMKEYPTPLGKKTYDEYAKELKEFNLSAEPKLTKVELGLVDDFEKLFEKSEKNLMKTEPQYGDILNNSRKLYKEMQKVDKNIDEAISNYSTLNKKAKELGVDLDGKIKTKRKRLDNFKKTTTQIIGELKGII